MGQDKINKSTNGNSFNVSAHLEDDEAAPDEYQIFRSVVTSIESGNPDWYRKLTGGLTPDNVKAVQEVFKLCEQRQAAKRSKSIEQAGGYQFNQQAVPGQFNFAQSGSNFTFGGN